MKLMYKCQMPCFVLVITMLLISTRCWGQSNYFDLLKGHAGLCPIPAERIETPTIVHVGEAGRNRRSVDQGHINSSIGVVSLSPQDETASRLVAESGPTPGTVTESEPTLQPFAESDTTSQPVAESEPTSEPFAGSEPTSQPVSESEPTSNPVAESEPSSEPIAESQPTSEPVAESEPTSQTVSESEPTSDPVAEFEPSSEPVADSEPTAEPVAESKPTSKPVAESKTTSQPVAEYQPTSEPIKGFGLTSEPIPETGPISEPQRSPKPESEPESLSEPEGFSEPEQNMNISWEPSAEPGSSLQTNVFVVTLSILILLILLTDITLIVTILKTKTLRKPSNVMILSLSFADISIACFVIPGVISAQFSEMWMSIIICKICHFFSYTSLAAGSFSLVGIALDRLRAIALPLKPKLSMIESAVVVGVIWFLSLLYGFRAPLLFTITPVDVMDDFGGLFKRMVCGVPESESVTNVPLVVLDFTIVFALPAVTIIASYAGLLYFVSKNSLKTQFSKPGTKRNSKALRLSILMISMFIVCHLPVHSIRLYISRAPAIIPETFDMIRAFDIISYVNSVLDPIVYGFLHKQTRDGFLKLIGKVKSGQSSRAHNRVHPGGDSGEANISKIATVNKSGSNPSLTRLTLP